MKKFFAATLLTAAIVAPTGSAMAITDETVGGAPLSDRRGIGASADRGMRTTISLNAVQAAFDDSDPRANVLRFRYNQNTTYKLRLREFMDTTVSLPQGESVDGFSLADEHNFHFKPYTGKRESGGEGLANIFTLNADRAGADTNLTIIGRSGRIYSFYLRSDSVKSTHMPTLVAYILDDDGKEPVSHAKPEPVKPLSKGRPARTPIKPATEASGEDAAEVAEYLRSVGVADPTKVSLSYGVAGGDQALAPIRVFDDGYFTYFQMSEDGTLDQVRRLPVLYKVVNGYDTPVNSRVEKGTIVAESVGTGWTLRNGGAHLCIRKQ